MKKFIALTVIAVIYLTPLATLAQKKRLAPQTKVGRLTISVAFEAERIWDVNKKDGEYSENSKYTSKFTAKYQFSQSVKAVSHDGFVSLVEPSGASTNGKFTYEHFGHLVEKASGNGGGETDEKAEFSGEIIEVGGGGVQMADQGDELISADFSAYANGNGYSTKTVKDRNGTNIDKSCSAGIGSITNIDISDSTPNSEKPPETACTAKMEHSGSIIKKVVENPIEQAFTGNWSPMVSSGSLAAGKYQFVFKGAHSPKGLQKDENGEKITYTETLIVEGILTLGGGTVKKAMNIVPSEKIQAFLPEEFQYFFR